MYPNIDTPNLNVPAGGGWQGAPKTPEYKTDAPVAPETPRVKSEKGTTRVAEKTAPAEKAAASGAVSGRKKPGEATAIPQDQATFNMSVTREERDALVAALSGGDEAKSLSQEEKETARAAADRISKHLDDAMAKNAESRAKVEKAVTEWYAKLSRGEQRSATELIDLLHKAAAGLLDQG